ncbi:hybrid signal transduction histidine kinase L-like, partial [Drosophila willistoni]|uniref:hybrid signal transduction histidine kinase L-like n=1 Tax=Drosophila willistoni TaxID=7260 RepID=UPI001F084672
QQPQQQPQQEQQHQTEELPAPAPVYEKEPVTRSYNLYESTSQQSQSGEQNGSSDIERNYLTKYYNYPYPPPHLYRNIEAEAEEKVRLSASTEIPKSEIMKQIEKSVIKYMKELEAEGKILSTPQEQSAASSSSASSSSPPPLTKTYYKPISSSLSSAAASSEEKRYSSSTIRPKILNQGQRQQQQQPHQHQQYHHVQHSQQHTVHAPHASHVIHQHPAGYHQQLSKKPQQQHPPHPQQYQSETETAYQAPEIPVDELSPNVEFIYKIKTRAPLQTATVKTVSKPYTLPLKSSEHFDHGAALKNIEEFDLSHVVTTPERIEDDQRVTSKPQKLYFNSEIYHDINSLPYKGEKLRQEHQLQQHHLQHQEYRHKLKAASDSHSDYKGYTGYFAEPEPEFDRERERERDLVKSSSESLHDDGYPLINPYQYVLKKEPKYHEDLHGERDSLWDQPLRLTKHSAPGGIYKSPTGSNLEYDSYSPKFNNNPEGYGYQHTYKSQALRAVGGGGGGSGGGGGVSGSGGASIGSASAGKRGKRGGVPPPVGAQGKKRVRTVTTSPGIVSGKLVKDMEANLALRPPPKN